MSTMESGSAVVFLIESSPQAARGAADAIASRKINAV
jgi:hypothetical protein